MQRSPGPLAGLEAAHSGLCFSNKPIILDMGNSELWLAGDILCRRDPESPNSLVISANPLYRGKSKAIKRHGSDSPDKGSRSPNSAFSTMTRDSENLPSDAAILQLPTGNAEKGGQASPLPVNCMAAFYNHQSSSDDDDETTPETRSELGNDDGVLSQQDSLQSALFSSQNLAREQTVRETSNSNPLGMNATSTGLPDLSGLSTEPDSENNTPRGIGSRAGTPSRMRGFSIAGSPNGSFTSGSGSEDNFQWGEAGIRSPATCVNDQTKSTGWLLQVNKEITDITSKDQASGSNQRSPRSEGGLRGSSVLVAPSNDRACLDSTQPSGLSKSANSNTVKQQTESAVPLERLQDSASDGFGSPIQPEPNHTQAQIQRSDTEKSWSIAADTVGQEERWAISSNLPSIEAKHASLSEPFKPSFTTQDVRSSIQHAKSAKASGKGKLAWAGFSVLCIASLTAWAVLCPLQSRSVFEDGRAIMQNIKHDTLNPLCKAIQTVQDQANQIPEALHHSFVFTNPVKLSEVNWSTYGKGFLQNFGSGRHISREFRSRHMDDSTDKSADPVTSQLGQQEDTLKSSIDFGNSKDAPEEIQAPHLQLEKEAQAKLPSADLPEQADMWESDITSQVNPKAANVSLEHDVEGYSEDKSVPTENNSDPHQELDDKITHESEPSRDKPEQVKSIANSEWTSRAAPDVQVKDGSRDSMEPLIADDGGADSDESDIKDDVNMPEIAHTLPKQVLEQETSDWPISKSIDTISEGNEQRLKSGRLSQVFGTANEYFQLVKANLKGTRQNIQRRISERPEILLISSITMLVLIVGSLSVWAISSLGSIRKSKIDPSAHEAASDNPTQTPQNQSIETGSGKKDSEKSKGSPYTWLSSKVTPNRISKVDAEEKDLDFRQLRDRTIVTAKGKQVGDLDPKARLPKASKREVTETPEPVTTRRMTRRQPGRQAKTVSKYY